MKRIMRLLLVVGLVAGSLALCSPTSQAGPFRRGWGRGYGWGRVHYGPGFGYRTVYRPYGMGYGGYGFGYPGSYGVGYGGYPAYGLGMYGAGYSGLGYGGFGYPAVYGSSISVGTGMGGFYMGSYPF